MLLKERKVSEDYIIPGFTTIMLSCLLDLKMYSQQFTMLNRHCGDCLKLRVISLSHLWALVNNLKEFLKDKHYVERAKKLKKLLLLKKISLNGRCSFRCTRKFENVAKDFKAIHRASENIKEKTEELDEIENQQEEKKEII